MVGVGQRDQRRPHRDAADEVGRSVDRVDDPPPRRRGVADQAVLLAEQAVAGRCAATSAADGRLRLAVGLGDLRVVGLPVEAERSLVVVRQRDRIGDVGEVEAEREVGGEVTVAQPVRWSSRELGRPLLLQRGEALGRVRPRGS